MPTKDDCPAVEKRIILISTNFGQNMGGEAIKAYQYAKYLEGIGRDFLVITHGRCRFEVERALPPERYRIIDDDSVMLALWRSRIFASWLNIYFHSLVRRRILAEGFDPNTHILHYIAPISPVAVRLPPPGFEVVIGPLSGNIYYPPAFRHRMGLKDRVRDAFHPMSQRLFGALYGDKRKANALLVSGYERTRASLRLAGCRDAQMLDVLDSGIGHDIAAAARYEHTGKNHAFVCLGRFVDYKGFDLAIKAIARLKAPYCLDIYGDGAERSRLEMLVQELDVADRVTFRGWLPHAELAERFRQYRGYVFPTLGEANGIVMQEMMMLGLPVITLRWGGPEMLANDDSAIYIDPIDEGHVVNGIVDAMQNLADYPDRATDISTKARSVAEARFTWLEVANSWMQGYDRNEK